MIGCKGRSPRRAHWINLREEPVVYLNNRPFVLREMDFPFRNLVDFQGINATRLGQIETRLRTDILTEAELNNGNILVHDEIELGHIRPCWESVHIQTVNTSAEVYAQLQREGYRINYQRIPVTAESMLDPAEFDAIAKSWATATLESDETVFIFNCQMGRGRSTVGTIIVYLLQLQKTFGGHSSHGRASSKMIEPLKVERPYGLPPPHPIASPQPPTPANATKAETDAMAAYRRYIIIIDSSFVSLECLIDCLLYYMFGIVVNLM
jgi:hypothetical protein